MKQQKNEQNNVKRRKRKNGIWFNNTTSIDLYAQAKAEKLQNIIENIIFYGITIPVQLIQTGGIFIIAYFNNAFPALAFFLLGFFFTRAQLGDTFHLNSTIACTTMTWTIFFLITALIPSIYISVFLCIILGCLLSIWMNYIIVKEEEKCRRE